MLKQSGKSGTVTVARGYGATAANLEGARVWAWDMTEGTIATAIGTEKENINITCTNSAGQYIIDLANITSAYANGDTVRVYVEAEDILTWTDHTVSTTVGAGTVNFTLSRRSGLKDGLTKSVKANQRAAGLEHLGTGMRPGLKDGLT